MNSFNTEIIIQLGNDIRQNNIPQDVIKESVEQNQWFTSQSIQHSIDAIIYSMLDNDKLHQWLSKYDYKDISNSSVGIIMAGNIPLVGFMDLLTVIVLGAKPFIKPSSKDRVLMEWITKKLNLLGADIKYIDDNSSIDYLIATGSNNSNRYFEDNYPNVKKLLRHSRTSVAILDNDTTQQQIEKLWEDCFSYFGLGCRNVTHLFIPTGFDLNKISNLWIHRTINHEDFISSYKQQKAILTMKNIEFTDCGYMLLYSSSTLFAMIGTLSYSHYESTEQIKNIINQNIDNIQCVIGENNINFGDAQHPQLWDYADNIDVISFLYNQR